MSALPEGAALDVVVQELSNVTKAEEAAKRAWLVTEVLTKSPELLFRPSVFESLVSFIKSAKYSAEQENDEKLRSFAVEAESALSEITQTVDDDIQGQQPARSEGTGGGSAMLVALRQGKQTLKPVKLDPNQAARLKGATEDVSPDGAPHHAMMSETELDKRVRLRFVKKSEGEVDAQAAPILDVQTAPILSEQLEALSQKRTRQILAPTQKLIRETLPTVLKRMKVEKSTKSIAQLTQMFKLPGNQLETACQFLSCDVLDANVLDIIHQSEKNTFVLTRKQTLHYVVAADKTVSAPLPITESYIEMKRSDEDRVNAETLRQAQEAAKRVRQINVEAKVSTPMITVPLASVAAQKTRIAKDGRDNLMKLLNALGQKAASDAQQASGFVQLLEDDVKAIHFYVGPIHQVPETQRLTPDEKSILRLLSCFVIGGTADELVNKLETFLDLIVSPEQLDAVLRWYAHLQSRMQDKNPLVAIIGDGEHQGKTLLEVAVIWGDLNVLRFLISQPAFKGAIEIKAVAETSEEANLEVKVSHTILHTAAQHASQVVYDFLSRHPALASFKAVPDAKGSTAAQLRQQYHPDETAARVNVSTPYTSSGTSPSFGVTLRSNKASQSVDGEQSTKIVQHDFRALLHSSSSNLDSVSLPSSSSPSSSSSSSSSSNSAPNSHGQLPPVAPSKPRGGFSGRGYGDSVPVATPAGDTTLSMSRGGIFSSGSRGVGSMRTSSRQSEPKTIELSSDLQALLRDCDVAGVDQWLTTKRVQRLDIARAQPADILKEPAALGNGPHHFVAAGGGSTVTTVEQKREMRSFLETCGFPASFKNARGKSADQDPNYPLLLDVSSANDSVLAQEPADSSSSTLSGNGSGHFGRSASPGPSGTREESASTTVSSSPSADGQALAEPMPELPRPSSPSA